MKFFPAIGAAAAFFSLCFVCAASTPSDEAAADPAELFRRAPDFLPGDPLPLRGVPLWHTNDMLSRELIHEMIFRGKENGFGGYAFLPVDSTLPKYLTEEYFDAFGYMLRQADEAGMKIVFYDDIGFPSGTAGGELQKKFPDAMAKRLDKYEWKVTGPCPLAAEIPIPLSDSVEYGVNAGVLQAAVAMNTATERGGAVCGDKITATRTTFTGNKAGTNTVKGYGGAIAGYGVGSNLTLENCTLNVNSAACGGAVTAARSMPKRTNPISRSKGVSSPITARPTAARSSPPTLTSTGPGSV